MVKVNTRFPGDLVSIIHEKNGFSVDYNLTTSSGSVQVDEAQLDEHGNPPYKPVPPLQNPAYSRLIFTIMNGDKNYVWGNFPASDIEAVYNKSKRLQADDEFLSKLKTAFTEWGVISTQKPILTNVDSQNENSKTEETEDLSNNLAFTTVFKFGAGITGKSPAQVCIEDGNIQKVENQKTFLSKNVDRYPANQTIIDACTEAIRLFNEGKLTAQTSCNAGATENAANKTALIYDSENKPIKTIAKHANGADFTREEMRSNWKETRYFFTYRITIEKDYSRRNPIKITISNVFAALKTAKNGQAVPDMTNLAKRNNTTCGNTFYMYMTEDEWVDAITYIHLNYMSHVINTQHERVENCKQIREENRLAAKEP